MDRDRRRSIPDWTIKPYKEANHPPVVKLDHAAHIKARPGDRVDLGATASSDPDDDPLSLEWFCYEEPGTRRMSNSRTGVKHDIVGFDQPKAWLTVKNKGDSRYAFTVLANGPVRSVIRARTFNWDSGHGRYAVEQTYSAYAGQSYSTARVKFITFEPEDSGATFAVGMRKRPGETSFHKANGIVISGAPEAIRN